MREQADGRATRELGLQWAENEERFHQRLIAAARNCWLAKIGGDLLVVSQAFAPVP